MARWKPDPTFYPSPRLAMQGQPETLAYVATLNTNKDGRPDAMAVVDVNPKSPAYGKIVGKVNMPSAGDELHHFGWNACSSALCPYASHPHIERRYLVVPGLRSSRIHIIDTKPDPRELKIVKVIEPEEVMKRARYSRPHTVHCGPEGIYISALGSAEGSGPGGVFLLDCESFDVLGQWEVDRGPQYLAYDFWWHYGAAAIIFGFGCYRLVRSRHLKWVGMRVGFRDLTLWSFIMASAHGAGLMLAPIILARSKVSHVGPDTHTDHLSHSGHTDQLSPQQPDAFADPWQWLGAIGAHSLGFLLAVALIALLVYEKFGLTLLSRAWFNIDWFWAIALMVSGVLILFI
jgi:56kDa selenium binding protein (SBP56)